MTPSRRVRPNKINNNDMAMGRTGGMGLVFGWRKQKMNGYVCKLFGLGGDVMDSAEKGRAG